MVGREFVFSKTTFLEWPANSFDLPHLQAHRGFKESGAKENTLEAFSEAKINNFQIFECDIQLTKDHVPIVFHDLTLQRMCLGETRSVASCTLADLKQIAPWIPTLEEVFQSTDRPEFINIELKTSRLFHGKLEFKVIELIKKYNLQDRVLVSSFNPFSLWCCSQFSDEIPLALLATQQKEPGNYLFLREMWSLPFLKVHLIHLDYKDYSANLDLMPRHEPMAFWTVNDLETGINLLENGARSIISDVITPAQLKAKNK